MKKGTLWDNVLQKVELLWASFIYQFTLFDER